MILRETKIGPTTRDDLFISPSYFTVRRDREHGGGEILVFINKCYSIRSLYVSEFLDFESIALTINAKYRCLNIITGYIPHTADTSSFLTRLDSLLLSLDLQLPTFVVGDFNNNMLSNTGDRLKSFMSSHNFIQLVEKATHFQRGASTLLDVVFSNAPKLVEKISVIDCPESNHCFVSTLLNIQSDVSNPASIRARVINEEKLLEIKSKISCTAFSVMDVFETVNDKWFAFKKLLL